MSVSKEANSGNKSDNGVRLVTIEDSQFIEISPNALAEYLAYPADTRVEIGIFFNNMARTFSTPLKFPENADLQGADLQGANLQGADLQGADLRGANLCMANLQNAFLAGADLQGAILYRTNLQGAKLLGAKLLGADLLVADLQGADLQGANLQGADLQGADLQGANLCMANLCMANLAGANLEGAKLYRTNLAEANLEGAKLKEANLQGADLQGANLQGADLEGAKLKEANLCMANLQNAFLEWADLEGTILIGARNVVIPPNAKNPYDAICSCQQLFDVITNPAGLDPKTYATYVNAMANIVKLKHDATKEGALPEDIANYAKLQASSIMLSDGKIIQCTEGIGNLEELYNAIQNDNKRQLVASKESLDTALIPALFEPLKLSREYIFNALPFLPKTLLNLITLYCACLDFESINALRRAIIEAPADDSTNRTNNPAAVVAETDSVESKDGAQPGGAAAGAVINAKTANFREYVFDTSSKSYTDLLEKRADSESKER